MRRVALLAILTLYLLASPTVSQAQFDPYGRWEHGFGEPVHLHYSTEEVEALRARWQKVGAANKERADEWAGDYVEHGELSYRILRWSPREGFVRISVHTCEPMVTSFTYGGVSVAPSLIRMRVEKHQLAGHQHGHAAPSVEMSYLPVRWGERRYFVPQGSVRQFYNFVAGYGRGEGEWLDDFLVRVEDRDKPVSGMPVLPPGYERYVKHPIIATITHVGQRVVRRHVTSHGDVHFSRTPITLNVGSEHGVRRWMRLHLIGSDYPETIEIARVGRRTTLAIIERVWEQRSGEVYQDWKNGSNLKQHVPLAVGMRLTTSFELYHSETELRRR